MWDLLLITLSNNLFSITPSLREKCSNGEGGGEGGEKWKHNMTLQFYPLSTTILIHCYRFLSASPGVAIPKQDMLRHVSGVFTTCHVAGDRLCIYGVLSPLLPSHYYYYNKLLPPPSSILAAPIHPITVL